MEQEQITAPEPAAAPVEQPGQQEAPAQEQTEAVSKDTNTTQDAEPVVLSDAPPPFQPQPPQDPYAGLTPDVVAERFKDNKEALLKAFGLDEFAIGALDYYQKTGDLTPYLEVKTVDYTKLSDEQVMERKLREQYGANKSLSPEEVDLLVEEELQAIGEKLDESMYSEREVRVARARLKLQADEARKTFVERQQQFRAPDPVPPAQEAPPEPSYEQVLQQQWQRLAAEPFAKDLLQSKTFKVGSAQTPFNVQVDNPQELLATVIDSQRYQSKVLTPEGQPNWQLLTKLALVLELGDRYDDLLINHGKTLGEMAVQTASENVQTQPPYGTAAGAETFEEAFIRALRSK